jgi:hypothetical protein
MQRLPGLPWLSRLPYKILSLKDSNPTAIFRAFQIFLQMIFFHSQYHSQSFSIDFKYTVIFSIVSLTCFSSVSFILGASRDILAFFSIFCAGNRWQPLATASNRLNDEKKLSYFYEFLENLGLVVLNFLCR